MANVMMHRRKLLVQYPNFRSSTCKYDPCIVDKSSTECEDCRVQIVSDRCLGQDFMLKVTKGSYNYPYVLIADTVGCNTAGSNIPGIEGAGKHEGHVGSRTSIIYSDNCYEGGTIPA